MRPRSSLCARCRSQESHFSSRSGWACSQEAAMCMCWSACVWLRCRQALLRIGCKPQWAQCNPLCKRQCLHTAVCQLTLSAALADRQATQAIKEKEAAEEAARPAEEAAKKAKGASPAADASSSPAQAQILLLRRLSRPTRRRRMRRRLHGWQRKPPRTARRDASPLRWGPYVHRPPSLRNSSCYQQQPHVLHLLL